MKHIKGTTVRLQIRGYEGLYSIDTDGVVYRDARTTKPSRRHPLGRPIGEMALTPCDGGNGYLLVQLSKNSKKRTKRIHQLMAETFLTRPDNAQCVNHLDKIKSNNSIENLEWTTFQGNSEHSHARTCTFRKDEKVVKVFNLSKFCKDNNLNQGNMNQVALGKKAICQGYTL